MEGPEEVRMGRRGGKVAQGHKGRGRGRGLRAVLSSFSLFSSVSLEMVFCKEAVLLESWMCLEAPRYRLK